MSDSLSTETVAQPTTTVRQVNRRSSPRLRARGGSKSICRKGTLGLGANVALALLDVSETGVRLRVKEPLALGQEVEVGLQGPGHGSEFKMTGRVVWCIPAADGTHLVGIHFDKPLNFKAVQDLGQMSGL
jgi:hypothetical protein